MNALATLLLVFSIAHNEPRPEAVVRDFARALVLASPSRDVRMATAAVCWEESRWGRYGRWYCGCYRHRRSLRSQVHCASRVLGRNRARCGSWVAALSRYQHGNGCEVNGYGLQQARRLAWLTEDR